MSIVVELKISEEISANQSVADTYVVPNGKLFSIEKSLASGVDGTSSIAVVWDYGGVGEEVIWYMNADGEIPFRYSNTGDGTKKIAIEAQNGPDSTRTLSGYLYLRVQE